MTTNQILHQLINKRYTVYEGGGYFGRTNFLGFMRLLSTYANVLDDNTNYQRRYFRDLLKNKEAIIDAYISIKVFDK